MKKEKYIIIIVLAFIVVAIVGFYLYRVNEQSEERAAFGANLGNITQDIAPIEMIEATSPYSFQALYDGGSGFFNINRDNPDPYKGQYFTEPSSLQQTIPDTELTSSTIPMAQEAVSAFTNIFQKYPYIDEMTSWVGVNGQCPDKIEGSYPCIAIQFSFPPFSAFTGFFTGDTYGYIYVPFNLTQTQQASLDTNFDTIKEVAPNWYEFSGAHNPGI